MLTHPHPIVLVLIAALIQVTPLAGQQNATLIAVVTAAETGAPLAGAQVLIGGTKISAVTGPDGTASLAAIPAGAQTVEVRRIGYAGKLRVLTLEPGQSATVTFVLPVEAYAVPGIHVVAAPPPSKPTYLQQVGFAERKSRGMGSFITRGQVEKRRPRFMSDMLRNLPGIDLAARAMGGDSRASMARAGGGRRCPIQYFVDGVFTFGFNIDDVRPGDIEGVEVYRGASVIPAEFNRGSAMCGVILIWTRRGRD